MEIDLGYDGITPNEESAEEKTPINNEPKVDENGNPIQDVNQDQPNNNEENPNEENPNEKDKENPNEEDIKLEEGNTVTVEDKTYTVDKDGNLVDDKGNIFKKAEEVKDWLKEFSVDETLKISLSNKEITL